MSKISVSEINKLRQFTGLGLLDCKKALIEAEGDFDKAVLMLRKKGLKIVAGKQGREASEGVAVANVNDNKSSGVIIELSCETDFVAKNTTFITFAEQIAQFALDHQISSVDSLLTLNMNGTSVEAQIANLAVKVGERVVLRNCRHLAAPLIVQYVHSNYRIAVLVAAKAVNASDEHMVVLKDVAMQIASMNPIALQSEDVQQDIIQKELDIAKEQALKEGKAEAHIERIAQGRLNKFFKDNVLLDQVFLKDSSKTVMQYLKGFPGLEIIDYIRAQIK